MSQKIDDVLQILSGIRSGYRSDRPEALSRVRARVVRQIAKHRDVTYQTIADAYIRRLAPDIKLTPAFDRLVRDWLTRPGSNPSSLQQLLESHAMDRGDSPRIQAFFAASI